MSFEQFHRLHHADAPLLLANAWDAGSARLIEQAGAAAIATTSAGMAWSLGFADGDKLPFDELAAALARIARVIKVPLSADIEGGYSDLPLQVAEQVDALGGLGVVGINIEDGAGPPEALARKIEAIRGRAERGGHRVFVNARTDVLLRKLAPQDPLGELLQRARRYADAGADALFVPYASAPDLIAQLVAGQSLPLAVMACPGLPALDVLTRPGRAPHQSWQQPAAGLPGPVRAPRHAFPA